MLEFCLIDAHKMLSFHIGLVRENHCILNYIHTQSKYRCAPISNASSIRPHNLVARRNVNFTLFLEWQTFFM